MSLAKDVSQVFKHHVKPGDYDNLFRQLAPLGRPTSKEVNELLVLVLTKLDELSENKTTRCRNRRNSTSA